MTDEQIKYLVSRFLGWRLPENFQPDAGITFNPEYNVEYNTARRQSPARHQPSGTNLFDAEQAEAMVRYIVEGMPAKQPVAPGRELLQEWRDNCACGCDACISLIEAFGLESSAEVVAEPPKVIDWNVRATAGEAAEALSSKDVVTRLRSGDFIRESVNDDIVDLGPSRELADYIERLTRELEASHQAEANAFRNRDSAGAECDRLRAALKFYADRSSYEGRHAGVFDDKGQLALEALESSPVETPARRCPCGKCGYCDCDGCSTGTGCDYAAQHPGPAAGTEAPPAADWRCRKCGFPNGAARSTCWNCDK